MPPPPRWMTPKRRLLLFRNSRSLWNLRFASRPARWAWSQPRSLGPARLASWAPRAAAAGAPARPSWRRLGLSSAGCMPNGPAGLRTRRGLPLQQGLAAGRLESSSPWCGIGPGTEDTAGAAPRPQQECGGYRKPPVNAIPLADARLCVPPILPTLTPWFARRVCWGQSWVPAAGGTLTRERSACQNGVVTTEEGQCRQDADRNRLTQRVGSFGGDGATHGSLYCFHP